VLKTPATKYSPPGKPAVALEFRGVKNGAGAPYSGALTERVLSGRVSIPGIGTLPDGSSLAQVPPFSAPITNGRGKASYTPPASPEGLITNSGGVEVLDPEGKLLAVTGSQSKP
jgi:hypothetical protein